MCLVEDFHRHDNRNATAVIDGAVEYFEAITDENESGGHSLRHQICSGDDLVRETLVVLRNVHHQ